MKRDELARKICHTATIKGKFTLRSGGTSDAYFDKYLLEANPEILRAIGEHMAALVPSPPDRLAEGGEVGGTIVVVGDVLCVLDRESGGREALVAEGLTLHPLFTISEVKRSRG